MVRGLLLVTGVAAAASAPAQSRWMHSLSVPMEMEYDSNPSMAPGSSPGSTLWLRVTPSLVTKYVRDNDEFSVDAALSAAKSSNQDVAEDRLDPRLRAAWKHTGPRDTTEFAALLDRRAFRDLDVSQQVPLGVDGSSTLFALTGNWTHEFDARTTFNTDVRQEWERSTGATIPDFRRTTAAARLKRALSERTSWYAGVNAQAYRPEEGFVPPPPIPPAPPIAPPQRSTVFGALGGVEHDVSENLRVDAYAGPVRFTQPESRSDWQGGVTAEYKGPRWVAGMDLLRVPGVNSTFGGLAVTQEVRLRLRYDLTPVSRLEAEAGHSRERAVQSSRTLASLSWTREWSPSWQFVVKGSLERQEGPQGTARSNRIGVALVYSAPDL